MSASRWNILVLVQLISRSGRFHPDLHAPKSKSLGAASLRYSVEHQQKDLDSDKLTERRIWIRSGNKEFEERKHSVRSNQSVAAQK